MPAAFGPVPPPPPAPAAPAAAWTRGSLDEEGALEATAAGADSGPPAARTPPRNEEAARRKEFDKRGEGEEIAAGRSLPILIMIVYWFCLETAA